MKFLVTGLGNPGDEYDDTRHNIGFKVLDKLAQELDLKWENGKHVLRAHTSFRGKQLHLIKPQTYMNLSGKAVAYWMQVEKIKLENVLVITDDIALPVGKLRIKMKGSDGGHNGLKSINASLNTQNYPRLRFGVGNDFFPGKQVEYVLGKWPENELPIIQEAVERAVKGIKLFAAIGSGPAMTTINAGK